MKDNYSFSSKQFGFTGGRSTTLQLLKVFDEWTEILDRGGCVDVIYCDFMKALTLCHTVTSSRSSTTIGFYSTIISWVKDFLSNRRQWVIVNGSESSWFEVKSGINKGLYWAQWCLVYIYIYIYKHYGR